VIGSCDAVTAVTVTDAPCRFCSIVERHQQKFNLDDADVGVSTASLPARDHLAALVLGPVWTQVRRCRETVCLPLCTVCLDALMPEIFPCLFTLTTMLSFLNAGTEAIYTGCEEEG